MRFRIVKITGNKIYIRHNDVTFPVFVTVVDGRLVVTKDKSIYIADEAFIELVDLILSYWRLLKKDENTNITQQDNTELP